MILMERRNGMIKNFDSYSFTNFIESLGINFSDFNLYPEQFTHKSDIHGINHTFRVMFNVLMVGSRIGDKLNTKRAFMAAYIHDMGRTNDGNCKVHGTLAAKTKLPKYMELFIKNGMNEDDLKAIKVAVVNHCEKHELDKDHPYYKTVSILRDADGLDLVRLDYEVKPEVLRNPESVNLMSSAEDLFSKTEFNHYNRFVDFLKDAISVKTNEIVKWYKGGKLVPDPEHPASKIIDYDDILEIIPEFRDFLIKKGAYEEFIKYCKKDKKEFEDSIKRNGSKSIIDHCLTWFNTSSGNSYWNKLDDEWNTYYA